MPVKDIRNMTVPRATWPAAATTPAWWTFPGPGELMEKPSMEDLGASSKLLSFWGVHAIQNSAQLG